jgi:hypothetical protein
MLLASDACSTRHLATISSINKITSLFFSNIIHNGFHTLFFGRGILYACFTNAAKSKTTARLSDKVTYFFSYNAQYLGQQLRFYPWLLVNMGLFLSAGKCCETFQFLFSRPTIG